jgi:hypothetical protein
MEKNPTWEADSMLSSASQEIPTFMKPEGPLPCSQNLPKVPTWRQMNPIATLQTDLPIIHFNIILPSTPRSFEWSISYILGQIMQTEVLDGQFETVDVKNMFSHIIRRSFNGSGPKILDTYRKWPYKSTETHGSTQSSLKQWQAPVFNRRQCTVH